MIRARGADLGAVVDCGGHGAHGPCVIMDGIGEPLRHIGMSGPMHMQVARMYAFSANASGVGGEAGRFTIHQPSCGCSMARLDRRAVELVTSYRGPVLARS